MRRCVNERLLENARILVVDDELLIALDLEAMFREAGADVVGPCTTLATALQAAATEILSGAMLDISLGRETTEKVAELLAERGIPFMFYSGHAATAPLPPVAQNAHVIAKPAEEGVLVRAAARLIGR